MTSHTFTAGNVITTVLDLTNGIGGRTREEILALTRYGAIREYSEALPDGRIITYSVEVEEEVLEEEKDIEIASSRTVATYTAEGSGGVVDTVRSVVEGEEITVLRTFSRSVSREDGTSMEVIRSKETEEGAKVSIEYSRSHVNEKVMNLEERYLSGDDHIRIKTDEEATGLNNGVEIPSKTFVSENGVLVTEL
jgi:hypothetical protein